MDLHEDAPAHQADTEDIAIQGFPDHLTLRQAIALHRARLGDVAVGLAPSRTAEESALFDGHDAIHALYDCDTDLVGESMADTWTLSGTTMTVRRYLTYLRQPAVQALVADLGAWPLLRGIFLAMPCVWRAWWRGRAQASLWDFDAWNTHLDETLGQLRTTHGIRPVDR